MAANSTTLSCGRNWQRLSIWMVKDLQSSITAFLFEGLPSMEKVLLLFSRLMLHLMTGFRRCRFGSPASSISMVASCSPCLTNSDTSLARPRCYCCETRQIPGRGCEGSYLRPPSETQTEGANEGTLSGSIGPNDHVQARSR